MLDSSSSKSCAFIKMAEMVLEQFAFTFIFEFMEFTIVHSENNSYKLKLLINVKERGRTQRKSP